MRPVRARVAAGAIALGGVALALAACRDTAAPRPDPADARAMFEESWRLFDRHYAFFGHFRIDWPAARVRHGAALRSDADAATLASAVCGLVNEARSFHAALETPGRRCSWADAPTYPSGYDSALVERALVAPARTRSGELRVARLGAAAGIGAGEAAIGYLRAGSFARDGWGGDTDEALARLEGVAALVVDVRGNPGGSEGVALVVAGRFADRERVYRLARFRTGAAHDALGAPREFRVAPAGRRFAGPVAVLTDRGVHSAAENFVEMLRVLPQVVTVGDTTFGTASNPRAASLPNGWTLRIPQSIETTPDGLVVEGHGLPPAVAVRLDPADRARGHDTILRAAVAALARRLAAR